MTTDCIGELLIRPFTPVDTDACLAVCATNVPTFFGPTDLNDFRAFLQEPGGVYLVGTVAGTVRACGGYYVTADGVAGLTWGMVQAEDHRRGFGTNLLRYRLERLRQDPRVGCVQLHTTPAVRGFFERFGFIPEGIIENGYAPGLDKVTMRLTWREAHGVSQSGST